jgi:hypothetical protein
MFLAAAHRQKIAKARRATRTPSSGLEMANQKDTSQPESWAVRVRSPCSLCVAACTELNQLQRQTSSSAIGPLRSIKIACEAFMVLINKHPKCLRQLGASNSSKACGRSQLLWTPRPRQEGDLVPQTRLALSSCYYLKRSEIDISQNVNFFRDTWRRTDHGRASMRLW